MTARSLVRQIADAGARVWLKGESLRIGASGPLPNAFVERLRHDKPGVIEILRLMPVCYECGAKIIDPVSAWWGGKPVHVVCGEAAWRREWRGEVFEQAMQGTRQ